MLSAPLNYLLKELLRSSCLVSYTSLWMFLNGALHRFLETFFFPVQNNHNHFPEDAQATEAILHVCVFFLLMELFLLSLGS